MIAIRVAHPGADYQVLIGGIADALPELDRLTAGRPLTIISDQRVFELHADKLGSLGQAKPILVPEGECAKDWSNLAHIVDELASRGVNRGSPIVAFGGGSVGDLAGFAASIFKRGCPIIQIPTTLLAQVDSAIGGKTAIDAASQKNLVGTFHHPSLVIVDPALLGTLDDRQLRSGYAEIAKYGLIGDVDFFTWCEANGGAVISGNDDARQSAIEHCIRAKARFVADDPGDTTGSRALLNFGHTFGHAIESVVGLEVLHGEAVAVGMHLALAYSSELELCDTADVDRVKAHFTAAGLPTTLEDVGAAGRKDEVFAAMLADKKAGSTGLALILARGIGRAFVARDVESEGLADFVRRAP